MLAGLQKFSGSTVRRRASSPELFSWREGNREVDFVALAGGTVTALEVTSGRPKDSLPGLGAFLERYPKSRSLLVGGQGIPVEEFLLARPETWLA